MSTTSKNCFAQHHMSCAEFGLWEQYRKITHTTNRLFEDPENTADRFAGESRSSIYRLRRKLVKKGWLATVIKSKHNSNGGRASAAIYEPLDHEQWVKIKGTKHCKQHDDTPVPEVTLEGEFGASQPVPEVAPASATLGIPPVPEVDGRFETTKYENKQIEKYLGTAEHKPGKDSNPDAENLRSGEFVPPMSKVALAPVSEVALVDEFPALEKQGRRWGARRGIDRALTMEELTEKERRNSMSGMLAEAVR